MSTYWHKQANGRKGKTLPWSRKSLTNVEWLLENQHFATITVMTDPGKKDHWKLKPLGETLKASLQNSLLISEGNEQLHSGEIQQTPLTELKVLIIDKWTLCSCRRDTLRTTYHWEGYHWTRAQSWGNANTKQGTIWKTYSLHSPKTSRGWENEKYQAADPLKETKEVREL